MSLKYFLEDVKASSNSSPFLIKLKCLLASHTLHLTFLFRAGQSFSYVPIFGSIFRIIIEYIIRVLYGSDISCKSTIGPGLVIMHGHDIVVGADVVIGRNCKIFNGVTFGNKDLDKPSFGNQPKVGDNCIFCTGAKIIGPINIADNVTVAANAVLLNDCLENTIVGGIPAKIIKGSR